MKRSKRFLVSNGKFVDSARGRVSNVKDLIFELCKSGINIDESDSSKVLAIINLLEKNSRIDINDSISLIDGKVSGMIEGAGLFSAPLKDVYDGTTIQHPEGLGLIPLSQEENFRLVVANAVYHSVRFF